MKYRMIMEYDLPDEFDPVATCRRLKGTFTGLVMEFDEGERFESTVVSVEAVTDAQ